MSLKANALSIQMKMLERSTGTHVPPDSAYVVRVDGRHFSSFTKQLAKPFDTRLVTAMAMTARELLVEFAPVCAYVHSDEISLLFAALPDPPRYDGAGPTHLYKGRVLKLASVIASYASVRFVDNMRLACETCDETPAYLQLMHDIGRQCFDGRVSALPRDEVAPYFEWRSRIDCVRNTFASFCTTFGVVQEGGADDITRALSRAGAPWESVPEHLKHGIFIKKTLYEKKPNVLRSTTSARCWHVRDNEESASALLAKMWPSNDSTTVELDLTALPVGVTVTKG